MPSSPSLKKPPPLKPGDTIAIAAPASSFNSEAFLSGVAKLRAWGFEVRYRDDIFSRYRYLAGDDARRFAELREYLLDPQVKAIFMARGGYGAMRLLTELAKLPRDLSPKIILGYSDITSLLLFAMQQWAWVVFQGPVVAKDISENLGPLGEASLKRTLCDARPLGKLTLDSMTTLYPGVAQGPLVGGCLSLIVCSLGTPFAIRSENSILYLEDVGEKLYSIDRMLTHLRLAGVFDKVRGIVFGPLKDAHDKPEVIIELLKDLLCDLKIPLLFGFPCGHTSDSWTLPMGLPVVLDADAKSLEFRESALEI